MNLKQFELKQIKITLAIAIALANWSSFPSQTKAQIAQSSNTNSIWLQLTRQQEPIEPSGSGKGTPGGRQGVGGRPIYSPGDIRICRKSAEKSMIALVPNKVRGNSEYVLGITTSEYPTFWFYVCDSAPFSAKFVLLDDTEKEIYARTFQLTEKAGIVAFSLPANSTVRPLETGKRYKWLFSVVVNKDDPSENILVRGWIRRDNPQAVSLSQIDMEKIMASPWKELREYVALYASNGIWYEAVTLLGDRRVANPNDPEINADWKSLLESIGLGEIANEPIVQRYTPEN